MYNRWKAGNLQEGYNTAGLMRLFCPETVMGLYEQLFAQLIPLPRQ